MFFPSLAADWNSSFRTNFESTEPSFGEFGDFSTAEDDDDEFGDFAGGEQDPNGDYDFSQATGSTSPTKDNFTATTPLPPSRRPEHVRSPSGGQEILGPGVHEGAHISKDGLHVEAEVELDGKIVKVQVPRDELALHPEMISEASEATAKTVA
jgi:hypothetical protein